MKYIAGILTLLTACWCQSAYAQVFYVVQDDDGYVNVRGEHGAIVDTLPEGAIVTDTDEFHDWWDGFSADFRQNSANVLYVKDDKLYGGISQIYKVPYRVTDIEVLSPDNLSLLSAQNSFILPKETKFLDMLRNLFYLNEYLRYYNHIQIDGDYHVFRNTIWDNRIMRREETRNDIHLQREKCFLEIAYNRANSGSFYVAPDCDNPVALSKLHQDEVIRRDSESSLDFITHDIYEEWALDKIIQREFVTSKSYSSFFEKIGTALPIRRAFRNWLSDKIYDDVSSIESFITNRMRTILFYLSGKMRYGFLSYCQIIRTYSFNSMKKN